MNPQDLPGQFAIVTLYADGRETFVAACLRCDWASEKSPTRSALVTPDGPVIEHQRAEHP